MRTGRFYSFLMLGGFILLIFWMITSLTGHHGKNVFTGSGNTGKQAAVQSQTPWDYKVEEGMVGDLINGDMTILPDNRLLPNDQNYATGDKVWLLSYMSAQMSTGKDGKTDVHLSTWQPIKTYKSIEEANKALAELKQEITTEVDLVGVYKTEYQGKFREFAVLTLPTGNQIKQPIDEDRYKKMKSEKKVKVQLEQVHDYANYDSAMAKFRGWAE